MIGRLGSALRTSKIPDVRRDAWRSLVTPVCVLWPPMVELMSMNR